MRQACIYIISLQRSTRNKSCIEHLETRLKIVVAYVALKTTQPNEEGAGRSILNKLFAVFKYASYSTSSASSSPAAMS